MIRIKTMKIKTAKILKKRINKRRKINPIIPLTTLLMKAII
jgi:hypothetical protein